MRHPETVAVRCLIVDDNDQFLAVARDVLQRHGVTVVGLASTSAAALRQIEVLKPDVALIDVDLGEENGFDLARQLAERDAGRCAVILISAYAESEFADLAASSPALAFLPKSGLSGEAVRSLLATSRGSRSDPDSG